MTENDSFFDTNVIVNYANFTEQTTNNIIHRCFVYINNKKGKFIISFYVRKELDGILEKRAIINKVVSDSIKKGSFYNSRQLSERDLPYAKKQYENLKYKKNAQDILFEELDHFRTRVYLFRNKLLDKTELLESEINISLVNVIREFIEDYSDCKVLASAIQIQQSQEQFLFVTADRHIDSCSYNIIENDDRLKN